MINDLQSYYHISLRCPKCDSNLGRAIEYQPYQRYESDGLEHSYEVNIPEHLIWICARCGFKEKSKTMDDSK